VETFFKDVPKTSKNQTEFQFICSCGATRSQILTKGVHNLLSHITKEHPDWEDIMNNNNDGAKVFNWMELVIMTNQTFSFVENPLIRRHSRLEPISVDTLMKYIKMVTTAVELKVAEALPTKFGIVIDGWKSGTTHYIAVFASYANSYGENEIPLLAIAPPFNEQDFTAQSQKSFIADVLEVYGHTLSSLIYLVADNAAVNTWPIY
jgi:hypothetical protein